MKVNKQNELNREFTQEDKLKLSVPNLRKSP